MNLVVKHGNKSIALEAVQEDATAADLSSLLVDRTGVLARQQKLVFKGKILTGNPKSLVSLGVKEGATLLLLAAAPTAGAVAAAAAAGLAAVEAARKQAARKPDAATKAPVPPEPSRITEARVRAWVSTGVIGLRGENLSELPEALFVAAPPPSSSAAALVPAASSPLATARAVDLGENRLSSLPERFVEAATNVRGAVAAAPGAAVAAAAAAAPTATTTTSTAAAAASASIVATSKLSRLRLAGNTLSGATALPSSFFKLSALTELVLDDNPLLKTLPDSIFALPLRRLSVARCGLGEIPSSVQNAKALTELVVSGQALTTLPVELAGCSSLTRLDASSNKISSLPEDSLARCGRLAVLLLGGNRLSGLPKDLLSGAGALHTLSLRGNEVTLAQLRETEGWEEFESRRVKAADARLSGRVDVAGGKGGGAFDATADAEEWIKW